MIWNPYTEGYFSDPYPHYAQCREENPVQVGIHGSWTFFRYDDIREVLRSNKYEASNLSQYFDEKSDVIFKGSSACPYMSQATKRWPMYMNGEEHKMLRLAITKAINSFDLRAIIDNAIVETNEAFQENDSIDLIDYCSDFIFRVTVDMFDLDDDLTMSDLRVYSNMLARSQDLFIPPQVYLQMNEWMIWGTKIFNDSSYLALVEKHLAEMGMVPSRDDLNSIMAISVMAAFETSKDNLTLALFEILKRPELIDQVITGTAKERDVLIEESFRYSSPLQFTIRVNKEPIEYRGQQIPENSKLFLCIASANRDPEVFDDPDAFMVDRSPNEHMAFGAGLHFCLGSNVARMEMQACLQPMVDHLKDFREAPGAGGIEFGKQIFMRTIKKAPLVKIA